jgi:mono/diheme cytochrome c family protein
MLVASALTISSIVFGFPWSKDMRDQPSIKTQETPLPRPQNSVPVGGGVEHVPTDDAEADRLVNPVAMSDSSIARGARLWQTYCIVCHGQTGLGNGPVTKPGKFIPPPSLLAPTSIARTDGFIYAHIRRGGPIMPSYRFAIDAEGAWNLTNYVRHLQRTNPQ